MATRTVFSDEQGNELDCYLNTEGKVYMSIELSGDETPLGFAPYITLDKNDVQSLIKILHELESRMEDDPS